MSPSRALVVLAWAVVAGIIWMTLASAAFLYLAGLWDNSRIHPWSRPWQWAVYAGLHRSLTEDAYLFVAALLASAPFALTARAMLTRVGGFRLLRPFDHSRAIRRGASDNHGHADYMPLWRMMLMFPPTPSGELGGLVVGEAERVDLGPAGDIDFDPEERATWGNGGKAPLLIDHCKRGSTHSMIIGGSGTFKSATLVASLLTWKRSLVCLDPSEELADQVQTELRARGRRVHRLEIGGVGPNVLAGIDITSPLAETRLRNLVARISGPLDAEGGGGARFKRWGRSIILCLLCHLMWSDDFAPTDKTLRKLREGLDCGEEEIRNRLKGISLASPSLLARSIASQWHDKVKETFDGALLNAADDTEWLASSTYADLVSGDAYEMADLVDGNLAVFLQVPQEALQTTPAVARVLIGCHLDAVIAAKGRVNGRVWFPIDEAVLVGADPALVTARDQGRKSKITLQMYYQSEGQVEQIWTAAGKRSWFDGLSWRTYAGFQNLDSAKELSAVMGTFGARATSEGINRGRSGRGLELASKSSGSNTSEHEISRDLAKPAELLADMRDDERITFVRNRPPMRHGAAIAFRRHDMAHLIGASQYRQEPAAPLQVAAE